MVKRTRKVFNKSSKSMRSKSMRSKSMRSKFIKKISRRRSVSKRRGGMKGNNWSGVSTDKENAAKAWWLELLENNFKSTIGELDTSSIQPSIEQVNRDFEDFMIKSKIMSYYEQWLKTGKEPSEEALKNRNSSTDA
jgi:hypothetical protein